MVNFEDGELVKGAYVVIDGKEYEVHMPEYIGNTPMSAENLNKAQKDLQKEIDDNSQTFKEMIEGKVLYEDAEGTNVSITLSDNASNYECLEILFDYDEYKTFGSLKIYKPENDKRFTIEAKRQGNQNVFGGLQTYIISDNILTVENFLAYTFNNSGFSRFEVNTLGFMRIYKVIGYK